MARTLTAAMQTALAAAEGYADVWLLELNSSSGTLRYCDKAQDILHAGQTWVGIGGVMRFSPPPETTDMSAQSMRLTFSGVDTGVIAVVLGDHLRGRTATVHWGQIDLSTGAVVADPLEVFTGLLNDEWTIKHEQSDDGPGTATVSTTVVSKLARALHPRQVRTNITSHDAMLDRAGLTLGDKLFEFVPTLATRIIIWGERGGDGTRIADPTPRGFGAPGEREDVLW